MHEFLEYPEKDLTVPPSIQLKQYKEKDPKATGPSLDPLVLDLTSKGASKWNKKAATRFRDEFRSLGISECDDEGLIEAVFLTHVDYLRKLYKKQNLDVEGKVDETNRAKRKAQRARRKEVTCIITAIENCFYYDIAQRTAVQDCASSVSTHSSDEGNPGNAVDFPRRSGQRRRTRGG
jgi:hypothetical protein